MTRAHNHYYDHPADDDGPCEDCEREWARLAEKQMLLTPRRHTCKEPGHSTVHCGACMEERGQILSRADMLAREEGTIEMNETREGEEKMEKLGVQEDVDQEQLEKKAADGCPMCGKTPVRQGNLLLCPTHGSEPFEKQKSA